MVNLDNNKFILCRCLYTGTLAEGQLNGLIKLWPTKAYIEEVLSGWSLLSCHGDFFVVLTINSINPKWDQIFFTKPSITSSLLNVISKNMEDTKSELVHVLAWPTIFCAAEDTSQRPNWWENSDLLPICTSCPVSTAHMQLSQRWKGSEMAHLLVT